MNVIGKIEDCGFCRRHAFIIISEFLSCGWSVISWYCHDIITRIVTFE